MIKQVHRRSVEEMLKINMGREEGTHKFKDTVF
jgi:hypothetical protein